VSESGAGEPKGMCAGFGAQGEEEGGSGLRAGEGGAQGSGIWEAGNQSEGCFVVTTYKSVYAVGRAHARQVEEAMC